MTQKTDTDDLEFDISGPVSEMFEMILLEEVDAAGPPSKVEVADQAGDPRDSSGLSGSPLSCAGSRAGARPRADRRAGSSGASRIALRTASLAHGGRSWCRTYVGTPAVRLPLAGFPGAPTVTGEAT